MSPPLPFHIVKSKPCKQALLLIRNPAVIIHFLRYTIMRRRLRHSTVLLSLVQGEEGREWASKRVGWEDEDSSEKGELRGVTDKMEIALIIHSSDLRFCDY